MSRWTKEQLDKDAIEAAERERRNRPVGYYNNEQNEIYPAEADNVMKRMTHRKAEDIDGNGNFRATMPTGDGTMVVPVHTFQQNDAKNRGGKPLWTPIYSRLQMREHFENQAASDKQDYDKYYKMGIGEKSAEKTADKPAEEDFSIDLSLPA